MEPNLEPLLHLSLVFEATQTARNNFAIKYGLKMTAVAKLLADTFNNGGKILLCGNGGSAADAQHMAAELVGRMLVERRALPAIALTTDSSNLTAIGNDYGYQHVFARQVNALANPGEDVLIAISTSGNSKNVIEAMWAAKQKSCKIVALTGGSGGEMAAEGFADHLLCVEDGKNSSMIQEGHIFAIHAIVDVMDRFYL